MQELAARRVAQRCRGDSCPVFAAPNLVRAGEVIERTVALALREPQEAEPAMRAVVARIDGAGAAESENGLARSSKRVEGDGAIVMGCRVIRLCGDGIVETIDGRIGSAARAGNDAEVVQRPGVAGRNLQHGQPRGFGLRVTSGVMMRDRICNEFAERVPGGCRRGWFDVAPCLSLDA
jgi:hypothetical protein